MRVINKKIDELDLPFVMDKVTQGCGNCFVYAIRQHNIMSPCLGGGDCIRMFVKFCIIAATAMP